MTHATPTTDTGLTGAWHVSTACAVRADLALGEPGNLGGISWLDKPTPAQWATLHDLMWMPTPDGRQRHSVVARTPDGVEAVLVSEGGETVAFVPTVRG